MINIFIEIKKNYLTISTTYNILYLVRNKTKKASNSIVIMRKDILTIILLASKKRLTKI